MPEIHGLVRNALGERDGHWGGQRGNGGAHTGNTIYSNLSLAREQAKQTVFSLEVARRHVSCRDTGGSLELWGL